MFTKIETSVGDVSWPNTKTRFFHLSPTFFDNSHLNHLLSSLACYVITIYAVDLSRYVRLCADLKVHAAVEPLAAPNRFQSTSSSSSSDSDADYDTDLEEELPTRYCGMFVPDYIAGVVLVVSNDYLKLAVIIDSIFIF